MSESAYQAKIIKALESKGWYVMKLISTNKSGIPDILALKHAEVWFIEVKAEGGSPSPLQEYRKKELEAKHFRHDYAYEGSDFIEKNIHKNK